MMPRALAHYAQHIREMGPADTLRLGWRRTTRMSANIAQRRLRKSSPRVGARLISGHCRDDAGTQWALSSASSAGLVSLDAARQ
jgi:hypothetical protein